MKSNHPDNQLKFALPALMLAMLILVPGLGQAEESTVAAEIKALITESNQYSHDNLRDKEGGVSKEGSAQFWSSGGLIQWVAPDSPPSEYDAFSLKAKHITVIELPGGEAAVAMYYAEGNYHLKDGPAVNHYMTRSLEVYVKEDDKWVVRASHWSPVSAGSGTNQTSVD